MTQAEHSGIEFLARTAYRTLREWFPEKEGKQLPAWEKLTAEERHAFREMALRMWSEIWINSRPPVEPTPWPRTGRPGRVSCFTLLHDDDPDKKSE